jgi:hypothetical protein
MGSGLPIVLLPVAESPGSSARRSRECSASRSCRRLGRGVVGRFGVMHHTHPFAAPPHWFARQLTFVTYSRTSRTAPLVGGWLRLALVW